jgi:hypothetical protein
VSVEIHTMPEVTHEPASRPYRRLFVLGAHYRLPCYAEVIQLPRGPGYRTTTAMADLDCSIDEIRRIGGAVLARHTCNTNHDWYAMTDDGLFVLGSGEEPPRPWYPPRPGTFNARDAVALRRLQPLIPAHPIEGTWWDRTNSNLDMNESISAGPDGEHWCATHSTEANARASITKLCVDARVGLVGTWSAWENAEAWRTSGTRCGEVLLN